MKLSILVPIYNERNWVRPFWRNLKAAPIHQCVGIESVEIIIVDDGSDDGTYEILENLKTENFQFHCGVPAEIQLIRLERNYGKGKAVREAIDRSKGDVVIIQDSDLEYSPSDYPALLAPIIKQTADAVIGSRFTGTCRRVFYFWHSVVNRLLTSLCNLLNDIYITDMSSGYKAMRGHVARTLHLTSDRFGIEPELVSKLAAAKLRIYEVAISYTGRSYQQGKKITKKDAIAAFFHILKFGIWDREPFKPGLMQALTALDNSAEDIYLPFIEKALSGITGKNLRILDIGAGIGTLTETLLRRGEVVATDLSPEFVSILKSRFNQYDGFEARVWDATAPAWEGMGKFDVVVAINILEHIEDDTGVLKHWKNLLKENGHLILLVPNYPKLYSPIDKINGHFRRYRKKELINKLKQVGLTSQDPFYGNALGVLGWGVTGVLLQKSELPAGQLRTYAMMKRLLKVFETRLEKFFGLSIIVVADNKPA